MSVTSKLLASQIAALNINNKSRIKYIIGIDYGTTYTGVSYVTSNQTEISDIVVLRAWPGFDGNWKTPTRIAYGRENGFNGNKWGFEIDANMKAYSWTKLLLDDSAAKSKYDDPKLTQIAGKGILEVPSFRTAQGVCEDFLREVKKCVWARLEKEHGAEFLEVTPVECWITVPAIWSDRAKEATRAAAVGAGWASRPMDSINMIPEPEAAAISALKKDASPGAANPIKAGDTVMIVDCGGGTVDLTTYSVRVTHPVLDFEELVVGTGGKCGATYIDRNLHDLMSRRFGSSFDKLAVSKRGPGSRFMQSFEMIKRDFHGNEEGRPKEVGPLRMNCESSQYYDEDECMVRLSRDDLKSLFDPVVRQVIALVQQQIGEAAKLGHGIDRMILVGGFGDSPYLFDTLQKWCKTQGNIPLIVPTHPQAAVVLGASLRGLFGTAPSSTRCRRHYGYKSMKNFRPGLDKEEKAFIDPFAITDTDDGKMALNGLEWIIGKGEEVTSQTTKSLNLHYIHEAGDNLVRNFHLCATALDIAPDRDEDDYHVETVGSIEVDYSDLDLNQFPKVSRYGKLYRKLDFELRIEFGASKGVLDFSTWVKGKRSGTAKIMYGKK